MSVGNGRGMTRATIHGLDGTLGATVQQELLMRELPGRGTVGAAGHPGHALSRQKMPPSTRRVAPEV